jgi:hypothetical protein
VTRIAFLTNQPLFASGRQVFSEVASVRRELLLPAKVLQERGHDIRVISLFAMARMHIREELDAADCVVFGKIFRNPQRDAGEPFSSDAAEYERVLAQRRDNQRLYFCLSDDHFDVPRFAAFYRSVAAAARAWIVSSQAIGERLRGESAAPVHIYPEPVETPRGEPRVPRLGWRRRLAVALARRAKVGLDPWRLRLLWFGHPSNLPSLLAVMPELETVARDIPIGLECVTQPGAELAAALATRSAGFLAPFKVSVSQWSLEATGAALERSDAVLLPQLADTASRRAKSNNRLVDSLHAGRFAIAHPLASYAELRDYAWVGESIAEGLTWLLRHPGEALSRLRRGQAYVEQHHSLPALATFWNNALELA